MMLEYQRHAATLVLTAGLFMMAITVQAQDRLQKSPIEPRSMVIEGGIAGSFVLDESNGGSMLLLNPTIGVFVTKGLLLGGSLQYLTVSGDGSSSSIYSLGPRIAYYFDTQGNHSRSKAIYPFLGASFTFGSMGEEYDVTAFETQGGFLFMVSSAVGVDLSVRIDHTSYSAKGPYWHRSYGVTRLIIGTGVTAFIF